MGAATPSMGNALQTAERSTVKLNDPSAAEEIAVDSFPLPSTTVMLSPRRDRRYGPCWHRVECYLPDNGSGRVLRECERSLRALLQSCDLARRGEHNTCSRTDPSDSTSLRLAHSHIEALHRVAAGRIAASNLSGEEPSLVRFELLDRAEVGNRPRRLPQREHRCGRRTPSLPPLRSRTGPPPPR